METLVRNATLRFSKRMDEYEPLNPNGQVLGRRRDGDRGSQVSFSRPKSYREDKHGDHRGMSKLPRPKSYGNYEHGRLSMFSRPKSYRNHENMMKKSYSHRRDRAMKRHIFLQSYKLSSVKSSRKSKTKKLKRVVVKVKSLLVSVLSYFRAHSLRSCNSRTAISAALPTRVISCC